MLTTKQTAIALLLAIPFYFASAPFVLANADSLVVANDGEVILVIEKDVLAASTTTAPANPSKQSSQSAPQPPSKPSSSPPAKPAPVVVRSVSIAPANKPSTVTIQPTKTQNKVTVTVTEKPVTKSTITPTNTSVAPQNALKAIITQTAIPSSTTPPVPSPAPNVVSTQTVDRVILQGANNSTVVSITPSSQNQLLIQQDTVKASTTLPISIDSTTHALSAPTTQGEVKLILPKVVLDSVAREGLINNSLIINSLNVPIQLSLSQDKTGDVVYSVKQGGKLFGLIPVSPQSITVSNNTGKISAPLFSRFLTPFLR